MRSLSVVAAIMTIVVTLYFIPANAQNPEWPAFIQQTSVGNSIADGWGFCVDGCGDINGDGVSEHIIGVPGEDIGGIDASGAAYVYDGAADTIIFTFAGTSAAELLGYAVAGGGDIDDDGIPDFVVSAPLAAVGGMSATGTVFVYSGATGSVIHQVNGIAQGDQLGISVDIVPDLNGDNHDEFIAGAWFADPGGLNGAGSAFVYDGATGAVIYQKDGSAGSRFGVAVAGLRDMNGDSAGDFIVGAHLASPGGLLNAGSAYAFDGATGALLYQIDGDAANEFLGYVVNNAGDVNNDSLGDFVVAAYGADHNGLVDAGEVRIYDGSTGSILHLIEGTMPGEQFGYSANGLGDLNNDGHSEFGVSAPLADPGGLQDAGSFYVYDGATGVNLCRIDGESAGDLLARSIAGLGRVSLLGTRGFILGTDTHDPSGIDGAGKVYVVGFRSTLLASVTDVPDDQGRNIRIRWTTRPLGDEYTTSFAIFRRHDDFKCTAVPPPFSEWANSLPEGNWDYVTSVPAFGDTAYQAIVPTLADSTISGGMNWSVYFVRMATKTPSIYLDSPSDSGYSIDNLAPASPAPLSAINASGTITLDWQAVGDADFNYFRIYRDTLPSFTPDPAKLIGSTSDTTLNNVPGPLAMVYYKTSAVDFSGNEGPPSNEVAISLCACPYQCDFDANGFLDANDLNDLIDALFFGGTDPQDPNCPTTRGDFDNSGFSDALDLNDLIDHLFFSGPPPVDPCGP